MPHSFQPGHSYRRPDIYRIIGVPENTRGGHWDTGYFRHGDAWFILCNVGTSGRTGHNYANQWIGDQLEWYGKTKSRLHHSSIKSMLSSETATYIFWREDNQQPFIFAGVGSIDKAEDTTPVKVFWKFSTDTFPDEISPTTVFREGAVCKVLVNAYERSPLARQRCLDHYGTSCYVCGFDFGSAFGELGKGFIHVHHLRPLSEIGEEYKINPIDDLRPVCPNCHAMIHRRSPPFGIEEIKNLRILHSSNNAT